MTSVLTVELNNILHLTLNRPDKHNAFNPEMIHLLTESFEEAAANPNISVIVLRGEGPSFCSGADLSWMKSMKDYTLEENIEDSEKLYKMFESALKCPQPIVGVLHGNIIGGALGLAAVCDIVVAEENSRFCFSEVKLGLAPAVISPFVLRKMNFAQASEYMLSACGFSAHDAKNAGLIHYVESKEDLERRVHKLVYRLGRLGPQAVSETKKLLLAQSFSFDSKIKDLTIKTIAERRVSAEGQEGLRAFFDKEEASWKKDLNYES